MMDRTAILTAMGTLKLYGMKAAYDEIIATAVKRQHEPQHVIGDLFPEGGDLSKAEGWTGLRPMTPDGTPVLGPSRYDNLYLNTGHGTLGWTMACGSGRAVADLVLGREPEIAFEGLTAERYGR